ncbi:Golgi-associated PDZ and coiled-coil motif-containing protein-like [Ostrinia furnacalis]|uniref:Golgi-associated PDZ and coiled-coil motif-containing protein-like n=1 Tax=Ostrinia furnacalis TaxID=93504 RepID=UPI001039DD5D|nr:Golgi-associated PDZ and coiled-coil motif-containing protein-like [Ostrinia furnacalis]
MATTGVGFRWLDILEKEFDKACVELETSLTDLETEEPDIVFSARQKIATLSSCFAQLSHKSLTIFQNSAKLEVLEVKT